MVTKVDEVPSVRKKRREEMMLDRIGRLRHGGRLATGRRTAQQRASRIPDQNDVVAVPASADGNVRQVADGCGTPPVSVTRLSEPPENAMASLRGDQITRRWAQPGGDPGDPGERTRAGSLSARTRPYRSIESLDCQQEMTTVRRD